MEGLLTIRRHSETILAIRSGDIALGSTKELDSQYALDIDLQYSGGFDDGYSSIFHCDHFAF